jgi:osmotically-inducible protein OsmY
LASGAFSGKSLASFLGKTSQGGDMDQFSRDGSWTNRYGEYNRYSWSDDSRSEASQENHFGKGPKGYTRSPERIKEEACEILTRDFYLDASDIEVEIQGNILVLNGTVRSRRDKRLAEALIEDIPGVENVHNHLSLKRDDIEGWVPGIDEVKENNEGGSHGKN